MLLKISEKVLYVSLEDLEGVLDALRAGPVGENMWRTTYRDARGAGIGIEFTVRFDSPLDDIAWPLDTSPGDLVPCPQPDIKVYKNSECTEPWLYQWSGCWDNSPAPGSTKRVAYNPKTCRRKSGGGGFCVHQMVITEQSFSYAGPGCDSGTPPQPPTGVLTTYGMACQ